MPTELSWTEFCRSVGDLGSLLAFRRSGLSDKSRRRLRIVALAVGLLTLAVVVGPAYARGALHAKRVGTFVAVMPSLYLGFLALGILSAGASGGGREVIPREQAVGFPVSTTTDHLGSLLMAPLNIAWFVQGWTLLGLTAYIFGPHNLELTILPVLLWLLAATALAQILGWLLEWVRRGPRGILVARTITAALFAGAAALVLTHRVTPVLDHSPTLRLYLLVIDGSAARLGSWAVGILVLLALLGAAVVLGTVPARLALHRPLREELRLESGRHEAMRDPRSDLLAMVRIDRAAIWRSVPLRRGLFVLALMPGLVALAGHLEWHMITILPGLVVSGGALLFGVNSWCLDGRGALWRESLPASPGLAFASRVVVLTEVLLASAVGTLVLAALRAGVPTAGELSALICTTLVVTSQVVATSLRWSVTRPYATDMRSARATPAPPVVMAGYSARLALSTTIAGLIFTGLADVDWHWSVLVAVPLLARSAFRLRRTSKQWAAPTIRSAVVATVAS